MQELRIFENEQLGKIRTTMIDGVVYFVGKDVAEILGYSNTRDALARHVDDEDKNSVAIHDGIQGNPNTTVINESGLYSLILLSKMPKAKAFKHWVTSEVLPSIRATGSYTNQPKLPMTYIEALEQLLASEKEKEQLKLENQKKQQKIQEDAPKVSYYDIVINCEDLIPIRVIAKDYGWSAIKMNRYLEQKKVQYKTKDNMWLLYQEYADKGYVGTKTIAIKSKDQEKEPHTAIHTYWTQKGRLFIYELLKKNGILPLIEMNKSQSAV